jgi:type IV secretory pathway ATPase VirB11/archaellum biosynthesis ATPase
VIRWVGLRRSVQRSSRQSPPAPSPQRVRNTSTRHTHRPTPANGESAGQGTTNRDRCRWAGPLWVNVRKFVVRASHLEDLVTLGTLTAQAAAFLEAAVASGLNILVAGGTRAGKPTLP